jgi:hypothetical protein
LSAAAASALSVVARALLVGERIDTAGLERRDAISTTPLAMRSTTAWRWSSATAWW